MKSGGLLAIDVGATYTRLCVKRAGELLTLPDPERIVPDALRWNAFAATPTILKWRTPSHFWFAEREETPPPPADIQQLLLDLLGKTVASLTRSMPGLSISTVAIAFAGTVDRNSDGASVIAAAPNIWGSGTCPVTTALQTHIATPPEILVLQDDVAAGWRYLRLPAYTAFKNDIHYLTVASGLSGLRVDLCANEFFPYECGHLRVIHEPANPLCISCTCGGVGHLETLVSGRGSARIAAALAQSFGPSSNEVQATPLLQKLKCNTIKTGDIVRAFHQGDAFASLIVRKSAQALAEHVIEPIMLKTHNWRNLSIIINGGYVRAIGALHYINEIKYCLPKLFNPDTAAPEIIRAGVDDDWDPLFGAVAYAERGTKVHYIHDSIVGIQTSLNPPPSLGNAGQE